MRTTDGAERWAYSEEGRGESACILTAKTLAGEETLLAARGGDRYQDIGISSGRAATWRGG